jgi:membrane protease YdiL (CAAX protease family)
MSADSPETTSAALNSGKRKWIASPWHTLSILFIFGYFAFRDAQSVPHSAAAGAAISHAAVVRGYLLSILFEFGMGYWAWVGVHWNGGTLRDLTGGRWTSWRSVVTDVAIALPFWVVWELTAWVMHHLVDRIQTPTTPYHPPTGVMEITLWILLSIAAGIGEELVFRGYLQQQFRAATRSIIIAVLLQGLLFGLVHAYQGWKQVMVIAPLGILYGLLAAWRRNLRANMIAHAWSDMFEGWLKFFWAG